MTIVVDGLQNTVHRNLLAVPSGHVEVQFEGERRVRGCQGQSGRR